ncbi:MAG TPA: DNA translocase FtsK [Bacteriovoracaceae bacterium]|nr:DNA translocase FtsK [Bacteriovoracaceae bacterium]
MILPEALGEGLYSLIKANIDLLGVLFSIAFFGTCFFYLVSEKNFFKVTKYIGKQSVALFEMIKTADYSALKNIQVKTSLENWKSKFMALGGLKTEKVALTVPLATPAKLKITGASPMIEKKAKPAPVIPVPVAVEEELDEDEEIDDEVTDEMEEGEEEGGEEAEVELDEDEKYNDSEIDAELESESESGEESEDDEDENETEDEFEDVASPYQKPRAPKEEDKFFESEELINCLIPKNQIKKVSDPDEQYFVTIARSIEEKLKQFNITAQIINVLKGPVVDTFELELGPGVKVTGVTNLTNDLSLALMGAPIRMVYPMKGKSTIGIEVPRNPRDVIYLDEVLKSDEFNNSNYRLPVAMGKDAYGDAAVIDLAATPHLLVAGTTGAGKSVFINTLLVSLIIKFPPKKLKLIMLDPKQLELALYQRLPHLIMPVVTNPEIASIALLWAIDEMERRYTLLKDFAVKNIDGFNKKVKTAGPDLICKINKYYPDSEIRDFELPFIVIVVDEFADLMLSKCGKAIETSISRLAAKARASGIHIVLATQRPSTDIITGVIKANFPTRVSFRVFTNIDSRVILDGMGAEKLLGKGDMLFKQGIEILRMHSAYVDEAEIEALVDKLATLPIQYNTEAMEFIQNNGVADDDVEGVTTDGEGSLSDDKYDEAVKCVAMHRVASASYLQRRLGVGYNRAANLIEEMERHGVVGPAQGSKPRKVLVPPPSDSTP